MRLPCIVQASHPRLAHRFFSERAIKIGTFSQHADVVSLNATRREGGIPKNDSPLHHLNIDESAQWLEALQYARQFAPNFVLKLDADGMHRRRSPPFTHPLNTSRLHSSHMSLPAPISSSGLMNVPSLLSLLGQLEIQKERRLLLTGAVVWCHNEVSLCHPDENWLLFSLPTVAALLEATARSTTPVSVRKTFMWNHWATFFHRMRGLVVLAHPGVWHGGSNLRFLRKQHLPTLARHTMWLHPIKDASQFRQYDIIVSSAPPTTTMSIAPIPTWDTLLKCVKGIPPGRATYFADSPVAIESRSLAQPHMSVLVTTSTFACASLLKWGTISISQPALGVHPISTETKVSRSAPALATLGNATVRTMAAVAARAQLKSALAATANTSCLKWVNSMALPPQHCTRDQGVVDALHKFQTKQLLVTGAGGAGTHTITEVLKAAGVRVEHERMGLDGAVGWQYAVHSPASFGNVGAGESQNMQLSAAEISIISRVRFDDIGRPPKFQRVIHLTRCPLDNIASLLTHSHISAAFVARQCPILRWQSHLQKLLPNLCNNQTSVHYFLRCRSGLKSGDQFFDNLVRFWTIAYLCWNEHIESYASARIALERLDGSELCGLTQCKRGAHAIASALDQIARERTGRAGDLRVNHREHLPVTAADITRVLDARDAMSLARMSSRFGYHVLNC